MNGSQEAVIRLENVHKAYGAGAAAVDDLSLEVGEGEICVLVGPSGCGKTTSLKMVNRLVRPERGTVWVKGEDTARLDPVELRRRTGYVIQQGGLFPHLTVHDNVTVVPRLLGWDRARRRARADEVLELVGLAPSEFGRRFPHELSGGQRQRVGVARALAADPDVLLMDEPFSAVDPIARDRLQEEFLRLQSEVRKTVLFVTHDIVEAVRLGDRIAVLRQGGVLEQHDTPAQVLGSPATDFVAEFVGADRNLKLLGVVSIADELLEPPATLPAGADWPRVPQAANLRQALTAMLDHGTDVVLVTGDHGAVVGELSFAGISRGLAERR